MAAPGTILPEEVMSKVYKYVIIGGGTAGLAIAARLTEDPTISVLVLEAGESRLEDPKTNIPALMIQLYEDPNYDWGFKTTPQIAMNNRIIAQPRGKVLGGSSAINFMMLSHASKVDLDNWEKLGNPGWNFESMLTYYKKFERYNTPDRDLGKALGSEIIDKSLHGTSGPVQITFPHGSSDVDAAWRPTFQNLGLGAGQDPMKGDTLGGYAVLKFIDNEARRTTSASAYFAPNATRTNLSVLTCAHVNRILFDNSPEPSATDASRASLLQLAKDELDHGVPSSKQFELQKQILFEDKEADVQISFAATGFDPYMGENMSQLWQHSDPWNYVRAASILTHPFSRGSSHIESSDPASHTRIDPRYLSSPVDLGIMADAVLFVQKLFETKPLADFVKDNPDGNGKKIQPSFQIESKLDRARAMEFVKKATVSSWHPVGTCAMLPRAEGGVVDERLRVYGVKNLRVVDASIIPLLVRGNITSAVYAIADKASDMIKEDFRNRV